MTVVVLSTLKISVFVFLVETLEGPVSCDVILGVYVVYKDGDSARHVLFFEPLFSVILVLDCVYFLWTGLEKLCPVVESVVTFLPIW